MPPQSELLQGTLDLLILKSLALEEGNFAPHRPDHKWDIRGQGGSLFPALHRMEEAGWLTSFWGESETNRRAKFYRLTKTGKRQLRSEWERWERISIAIASASPGGASRIR